MRAPSFVVLCLLVNFIHMKKHFLIETKGLEAGEHYEYYGEECVLFEKEKCWCKVQVDTKDYASATITGKRGPCVREKLQRNKSRRNSRVNRSVGEGSGKLDITDNTDKLLGKTIVEANDIVTNQQIHVSESIRGTVEELNTLGLLERFRQYFTIRHVVPFRVDGQQCYSLHTEAECYSCLNVEIENQKIVKIIGTG